MKHYRCPKGHSADLDADWWLVYFTVGSRNGHMLEVGSRVCPVCLCTFLAEQIGELEEVLDDAES